MCHDVFDYGDERVILNYSVFRYDILFNDKRIIIQCLLNFMFCFVVFDDFLVIVFHFNKLRLQINNVFCVLQRYNHSVIITFKSPNYDII